MGEGRSGLIYTYEVGHDGVADEKAFPGEPEAVVTERKGAIGDVLP